MNRILLTGGTLIDGRRDAAPAKCDLLIEGDRVRRIGPAIRAPGALSLSAEGLIVAPGFIDSHSHSDLPALQDSSAQCRVYDGVTTEINGTCGFGFFPLGGPSAAQRRAGLAKSGVRADWRDAAGYFARVESFGSAINRGFLAGHGAIRSAVVG
jgi:N-acyl-D-amino-acid deacylase